MGSFADAEEVLQRIGQISMSRSSVWRRTQAVGEQFQELAASERRTANALPGVDERPVAKAQTKGRLGAALDGFLLNIRQEGWKEGKLAALYDVAVLPSVDKQTGETVELAHGVNLSYVAHLGGPDRLGEMAWGEAKRRGWEQAQDTQVLGDGASWIWNQTAIHFGTSHQVVDWYHATEHLATAAQLLKGDGTPACRRWFTQQKTRLYQGHADAIASTLQAAAQPSSPHAAALAAEATYFQRNAHRMQYLEMREMQWPIGSGMIESAAKQFKARFCGPGMRWSRSGAENLFPIRSAILSQRFDLLYAAAKKLPQP